LCTRCVIEWSRVLRAGSRGQVTRPLHRWQIPEKDPDPRPERKPRAFVTTQSQCAFRATLQAGCRTRGERRVGAEKRGNLPKLKEKSRLEGRISLLLMQGEYHPGATPTSH